MNRLQALAGIALSLFVCTSQAVTVIGDRPCGTWIKHREAERQAQVAANYPAQSEVQSTTSSVALAFAAAATSADQSWLLGYLSGRASASRADFLASSNADSIILWVDGYCQQHVLDYLDDAALALIQELSRR